MSLRGSIAVMELYIETLTGVLMELMVHPYETVYNVKAKINKLEGFPISEQHLIWQAVELDNEMSLQHYRIPDGATLRLVLNMRGGPINTRRVPLEESSLREMAEYFSDPVRDDPTSGDRPVTVIVYQQGEHINFFRLVDRDAPSSLSYSLSGVSDYNGEDRSPVPKEREDENEITRNKMKMLKEQMENLTLSKEKKQLTKRTRVPRPPSSGRPQSRTKLRHISLATGKETGILNKNARLPPVGQSIQQLATLEISGAKNSSLLCDQSSNSVLQPSGSAAQVARPESSVSFSLHEQKTIHSTSDWKVKHFDPTLDSKPLPSPYDTSKSSEAANLLSGPVYSCQANIVNGTIDASGSLPLEQMIIPQTQVSNQIAKKMLSESIVVENDKSLDPKEKSKDRPVTTGEKNADTGSAQAPIDAHGSVPTPNVPNNASIPVTEPAPLGTGQCRPNSVKGNRTITAQVIPHPPSTPPRYIPFASATGGRLLQHRHPPDVAKDGSLPTEAVLGYLMSPTRRTGVERKSGGVTLKSLNHKEVRAVSGMLRSIVRSANRSQAGYLMANRKLTQLPATPTHAADVPTDDPSNILRVLSGSHEGRVTPVRVRLPSVKVTKKRSTKRCGVCRKRTKLATGFQCRCGENFCLIHLCAEAHDCTYDYKAEGRKLIEQSNPVVTAPKLPKI